MTLQIWLNPAVSFGRLRKGFHLLPLQSEKAIDLSSRPAYFIMAADPLSGRHLTAKLIGCTHPVSLDVCLRPHTGQGTQTDARIRLEQVMPLPVNFSTRRMRRRLTVTLAYLSPIAPNRQVYRGAQLWFNVDDGNRGLVPQRQNSEWQSVRKGTLQHEIFTGEKTIVWNDDDLIIKVNCKEEAAKIENTIPYCLFVTFEVAEGFDVDLYADVAARIHQRIPISSR